MEKLMLDQVCLEIRSFDSSQHGKSSRQALEARENGNKLFARDKFVEALEFYSKSVLMSPNGSPELYFAFANRSAALFHLNRYQDCLEDINHAFDSGYPKEKADKLAKRQASCKEKLKKSSKDKPLDDSKENGTDHDDHCDYLNENVHITEIKSKGGGRGIRAVKAIANGSKILLEKAGISVLSPKSYSNYCYHCLESLGQSCQLYPCQGCNQIVFCGKRCATVSWTSYHSRECRYLDYLNFTKSFHYVPKIVLRILLINGVQACLDHHLAQQKACGEKISLKKDPPSPLYEAIYSLVEHPVEDRNDYTYFALKIIGYLIEICGEKIPDESLHALCGLLSKHFRQVIVNAIAIQDRQLIPSQMSEEILEVIEDDIGCGLFLTFRFINHSCIPNSFVAHFHGNRLTMLTLRDIQEGEEILYTYGVHYKYKLLTERRKMLRESYYFDCACEACLTWSQPVNRAFVCPTCNGPVVCDKSIVCLDCGSVDHLDIQKIIDETEPCIQLNQLEDKSLTDDGSSFKLTEKVLLDSQRILCRYLYKTHQEMGKLYRKLVYCSLKLGKTTKAVEYSKKYLEVIKANSDDVDINVLNGLLVAIHCYCQKHSRSSSPIKDKDYIAVCNQIKTLCQQLFPKSSSISQTILSKYKLA